MSDSQPSEFELKTKLAQIEAKLQVTKLALILGWLPFTIIGGILMIIFVTAVALEGSKLFGGDVTSQVFLGVVAFAILVFGLVAFYAFVFSRRAKLNAELSVTKAQLSMETGGDD